MPRSEPGLLVMCFNMAPFQATIKNLIFKEPPISQRMSTLYTQILYLSKVLYWRDWQESNLRPTD